jgi:hypothetical protein
MRRTGLMSCVVFGFVVACGGANTTLTGGDGGNDSGGGDVVQPPGDGGTTDASVTCTDGGTACGSSCVDTSSDLQNCGGCGIVCNTSCSGGVCQLIGNGCDAGAGQVGDNACLTIDGTNVYWGSGFNTGGTVWSVPIAGGCPSMLVTNQQAPHGMASDGTNLFYANEGTNNGGNGSIQRIPIAGGTPTPIATGQAFPTDVAVDATNVYWVNSGDGSVWKSDKATPNPINLVTGAGNGHAVHLRVDATNVYYTDHTSGFVYRVPIAGGTAVQMTTQVNGVGYLALDSQNVYYGANNATNNSEVLSVALNASQATPSPIVSKLPYINGVETDGTSLWYAEQSNINPYQANTGEIHRATVGGQNDTILASKQNGANCIAVDSKSVYWINAGGGMISKTAK